jgi:hypothetical protein
VIYGTWTAASNQFPNQAVFSEDGKILYEDEQNLFGESVAYFLPTGSTTFVDREEDGHRNGPDRLHRVHVYMSRRPGIDASRWLQDSSDALDAYRVSGFYTFVRDRVLTAAGVRGSHTAALIDHLGANNQLTADIRARFVSV